MAKPEGKESKDKEAAGAADKAGAGEKGGGPEKSGAAEKAGSGERKSALKTWLPAIVAVVGAPAICFAVAQFVLLPRLKQQLALPPVAADAGHEAPAGEEPAEPEAEAPAEKEGKGGKEGGKEGAGAPGTYEFSNLVVNLSGTMGTRYLKTSFIVTPADKKGNLKGIFEEQKAKLTDITLNVLSSLTLADLEEPGSKNVLREKLVATYNQALGKRLVDQVYFSDFVVQ